jgi:hypothetical protein
VVDVLAGTVELEAMLVLSAKDKNATVKVDS